MILLLTFFKHVRCTNHLSKLALQKLAIQAGFGRPQLAKPRLKQGGERSNANTLVFAVLLS